MPDSYDCSRAPWIGLPRDPVTVAGLRRIADGRRHPTRCRERRCRRFGQCRGPFRADPETPALVLPRCLLRELDALCAAAGAAEAQFERFTEALAALRGRDTGEGMNVADVD